METPAANERTETTILECFILFAVKAIEIGSVEPDDKAQALCMGLTFCSDQSQQQDKIRLKTTRIYVGTLG